MKQQSCRLCKGRLQTILSLGDMPLVNYFPIEKEIGQERKYPLTLCVCRSCSLVQLDYIVSPDKIFPVYHYESGASKPLVVHLEQMVEGAITMFGLKKGSKVLDIGANDGSSLMYLKKKGMKGLGVEPGKNIVKLARERGIQMVEGFFTKKLAKTIHKKHGLFDALFATHMLANVVDLHDFMEGIKLVLAPKGVIVLEVGDVEEMIQKVQFDAIYHEHYSYFSLASLTKLLEEHGLKIVRAEKNPFHGGSIRIFAKHDGFKTQDSRFKKREGRPLGKKNYQEFAEKVGEFRKEFRAFFKKNKGKIIVGYGAPAKAVTLLNYCGIGKKEIQLIIDTTTAKQGRVMPGVHIPIVFEEKLREIKPDYCILFAWNYKKEIVPKLQRVLPKTTKIIIPHKKYTTKR